MDLKHHQLLVFVLEGRRFALFAEVVVELVPLVKVTPLPGSPEVIEGVVDIRGEIVPVYDLRRRLGLPAVSDNPWHHLIVARTPARVVALRVDRALDLESAEESTLVSAEDLPHAAPFLAGVAKLPDGLVVIHDLEAFLTQTERAELEAALAAVEAPGGET